MVYNPWSTVTFVTLFNPPTTLTKSALSSSRCRGEYWELASFCKSPLCRFFPGEGRVIVISTAHYCYSPHPYTAYFQVLTLGAFKITPLPLHISKGYLSSFSPDWEMYPEVQVQYVALVQKAFSGHRGQVPAGRREVGQMSPGSNTLPLSFGSASEHYLSGWGSLHFFPFVRSQYSKNIRDTIYTPHKVILPVSQIYLTPYLVTTVLLTIFLMLYFTSLCPFL